MFRKFFSSKVYKVFDYIMRLILLNVAIFIVSLLLPLLLSNLVKNEDLSWLITISYIPTFFTFLPAIIACLDVIKSYELDHENGVFKVFFKAFKKNYRGAMALSTVILLVTIPLYNSYNVFNSLKAESIANAVGYVLTISIAVIILFLIMHVPLVMIYFRGITFFESIKLAFIFAFKDMLGSILMLIVIVASLISAYFWAWYMAIFSISLPCFLIIKITKKTYLRLYNKFNN